MATTAESACREFAAEFPTSNVLRAVRLAEEGRLTWEQVEGLFQRSLGAAMAVTEALR